MTNTTRDAFWRYIESIDASENGVEQDGEYAYGVFTDRSGEEVGFITYRDGDEVAWHITEA